MVDCFAWERGHFQPGDGGDVQDCAFAAGVHGGVEDGVGDVHEAGDVGAVHRVDLGDGEGVEGGGGAEGEAGLGGGLGVDC